MTEMKQCRLDVMAAEMNGESTLPQLYDCYQQGEAGDFDTDESDGLWLNYKVARTAFPYRSQDCYSRDLTVHGLDAVVLENDYLRASFVPSLGGKLWALYDKVAGKDLLFNNPVFRPAYLALRNAWASGGVEWNCGAYTGHHPYTCSPMFTRLISAEESGIGCPVLRMYNYERIRRVTWQMDFYLPDDARYLHCRMRVYNPNYEAVDMYWWSNIAVPTDPKARNVVPADFSFTVANGMPTRVPVPFYNGIDISYPTNNPVAVDYFFKTYDDSRRYTSHIGADGYGFVETSTSRLRGRKLFVWGQGQGGAKWQEFLSGDDGRGEYSNGQYCEIQCGLANSQFECLPMPPKTAWEWVEYYGAVQCDPTKIHGAWADAQAEVSARLEEALPLTGMEQELIDTHDMATKALGTLILSGEGWAALENRRRTAKGMKPISGHLDFGEIGEPQRMWNALLTTGSLRTPEDEDPANPPLSYQRDETWRKLLETAVKGPDRYYWATWYQLGCNYLAAGEYDRAANALDTSCRLNENAWNMYATAELYRVLDEGNRSASTMLAAARLAPTDVSLAKMTAKTLYRTDSFPALYEFTTHLSAELAEVPRMRLYRAIAAEKTDRIDEADELLNGERGIEVPDIQEGEVSVTDLWFELEEKKAKRAGIPFDRATARPPKKYDFRMNAQ